MPIVKVPNTNATHLRIALELPDAVFRAWDAELAAHREEIGGPPPRGCSCVRPLHGNYGVCCRCGGQALPWKRP